VEIADAVDDRHGASSRRAPFHSFAAGQYRGWLSNWN
jgi:hypothetical protein